LRKHRSETRRRARSVDGRSLLRTLVEARNESDPKERRELLDDCWAPRGVFREESQTTSGRDALGVRFAQDHADPGHIVTITAAIRAQGDNVWTQWQVEGTGRAPMVQAVTARVDQDGGLSDLDVTAAGEPRQQPPWRRATAAVAANPVAATGVVGGATYLTLRIPTDIFYARLGMTPDDVGLGPQVLVPQSLSLLGVILVSGAVLYAAAQSETARCLAVIKRFAEDGRWFRSLSGIVIVVVFGLFVIVGGAWTAASVIDRDAPEWISAVVAVLLFLVAAAISARLILLVPGARTTRRELRAQRRRRRDWRERRSGVLIGGLSLALTALLLLSLVAYTEGTSVISGGDAQGNLLPWRAIPAEIDWKPTAAKADLTNRCGELRLLGSAANQLVLYDTRLDRAFRVPIADVSVSTAIDCLWLEVQASVSRKHCTGRRCTWGVPLVFNTSDDGATVKGVALVRRCAKGRCRYRRLGAIDTNPVQLPAGRYRLDLTATDGDRSARQATYLTVP
jgi:hypothetical protein